MNELPRILDEAPAPDRRDHFATEADAAADFDRRCTASGLFERSFREVRGFYLAHRPGREQKNARIDRVLIPGARLRESGWTKTIGVEFKRSGTDFGAAVSQAIDYTYCNWNVGAYWMYCERIFLWPFRMPHGPLQSVMLQNGVGVAHPWDDDLSLSFQLERNVIEVKHGDLVACPTVSSSRKGSR